MPKKKIKKKVSKNTKSKTKKPVTRAKAHAGQPLLVELGTEELPPKALKSLSQAFGQLLHDSLLRLELIADVEAGYQLFATPRRLAVRIAAVLPRQPDRTLERRGPALKAAYDADGEPTKALLGFASSCGVAPKKLQSVETDKGSWVVFHSKEKGQALSTLIAEVLQETLKKLPIPKRMRWGDLESEFVRPVHWLVVLHGDKLIKTELLSVRSDRYTRGHRFHHPRPIRLAKALSYESSLKKQMVIADFDERRQKIRQGVMRLAHNQGGKAVIDDALLDEVTSLVEWPELILGSFEAAYLDLPPEPLVMTMQDNQKYFPVTSNKGKLLPYFICVSNIHSKSKLKVRSGNERVIRARFSDARFFWEHDSKTRLEDRVAGLKQVVFHVKLGSLYDKAKRTSQLACIVAQQIGAYGNLAERAGLLAKTDLLSGMVGEFPELQGVMGRYYALQDGEQQEVAAAIEEQYLPRYAGDALPKTATGQALAIAEKLDTLLGIFGADEIPTGDKDPFGLRRAALGALRIIIEKRLDLDLMKLLDTGLLKFNQLFDTTGVAQKVYDFMMERLRAYYAEAGVSTDVFDAVLACRPARPYDFDKRVRAVMDFLKLPEAESLTAANKRIRNILKQGGNVTWDHISQGLLKEDAEGKLARKLMVLRKELYPLFDIGDYAQAMQRLAGLRPQVDEFFDKIMVMVDEKELRDNRLALLNSLSNLFLRVADLSRLQG